MGGPYKKHKRGIADTVQSGHLDYCCPEILRIVNQERTPINLGAGDLNTQFLTPEEVSKRYKGLINVSTLANWRSAGTSPPYIKLNGRVLYELASLLKWEENRICTGTSDYKNIR